MYVFCVYVCRLYNSLDSASINLSKKPNILEVVNTITIQFVIISQPRWFAFEPIFKIFVTLLDA